MFETMKAYIGIIILKIENLISKVTLLSGRLVSIATWSHTIIWSALDRKAKNYLGPENKKKKGFNIFSKTYHGILGNTTIKTISIHICWKISYTSKV